MANKKIIMSVTASAAIASAIFAAEEAEAATHKVEPGDSLWKISQQYGTSVSKLKSLNNLKSDVIYPNQRIETTSSKDKANDSNNSNSGNASAPSKGSTYTVKAGDTLSGIAAKHNISLQNLMKWNNLDTTLIYPGNVFVVSKSGNNSDSGSNSGSDKNNPPKKPESGSQTVYTVKSGDTLSHIASQHGVTIANIKKWNNLKSDLILIGQKLSIGGAKTSNPGNDKPSSNVGYNVDKLVSVAKSQIGVPYTWGGASPSGFDCSGFIHYAYKNAGKNMGRLSAAGYFDRSSYVNKPQVGDLVFFSGTYKSGISHLGIYIGNNQFIHAGTSNGVTISNVNDSYWKQHFDSYKRFY